MTSKCELISYKCSCMNSPLQFVQLFSKIQIYKNYLLIKFRANNRIHAFICKQIMWHHLQVYFFLVVFAGRVQLLSHRIMGLIQSPTDAKANFCKFPNSVLPVYILKAQLADGYSFFEWADGYSVHTQYPNFQRHFLTYRKKAIS